MSVRIFSSCTEVDLAETLTPAPVLTDALGSHPQNSLSLKGAWMVFSFTCCNTVKTIDSYAILSCRYLT